MSPRAQKAKMDAEEVLDVSLNSEDSEDDDSEETGTSTSQDDADTDMEDPEQPIIWYEDGNVVLQAEDIQFKVHGSVVAMHSSVLGDLVKATSQDAAAEMVDGCKVVQLEDESSKDVEVMLGIIYGLQNYHDSRKPIPVNILGAMLRMGIKYDIKNLRELGLARLKLDFPDTLLEWDKKSDKTRFRHISPSHDEDDDGSEMLDMVIELAHECHIQTILPSLYLESYELVDAYIDGPDDISGPIAAHHGRLHGYNVLLRDRITKVYAWVGQVGDGPDCKRKMKCGQASRELLKGLWKTLPLKSIFWTWEKVDEKLGMATKLCEGCYSNSKRAHKSGRKAVWKKLPEYFGLPPWSELKDLPECTMASS